MVKNNYDISTDSLEFNKFEAKKNSERPPPELFLEAKIIRNFIKTDNEFWIQSLRYKSRTKFDLINEFIEYWSDIIPYSYINDVLILFEDNTNIKNKKIIKSNHIINDKPKIQKRNNYWYIENIDPPLKKFKHEDVIFIYNLNPIKIICKKEIYEIHWKIKLH